MGCHLLPACYWHHLCYYGSSAAVGATSASDELPEKLFYFTHIVESLKLTLMPLSYFYFACMDANPCTSPLRIPLSNSKELPPFITTKPKLGLDYSGLPYQDHKSLCPLKPLNVCFILYWMLIMQTHRIRCLFLPHMLIQSCHADLSA